MMWRSLPHIPSPARIQGFKVHPERKRIMKIQTLSPQSGFSLIEVFIVLIMIGILSTLALMQWGTARTDFQRQRISREFKVYLERARFDSVKRRAELPADRASVMLTSPSSFTVSLDFDGVGILGATETRVINFADRTDSVIQVSDAYTWPVRVEFDRRGLVTATAGWVSSSNPGTPVTPLFTICSDCSDSSPDTTRISISTSGTVAELRQGQDPQALPTPPPTNQASPGLNCYVLVNQSVNSACIPY
jgi:prepilin-type N-terminal cleavage/methylation domain-containing protein